MAMSRYFKRKDGFPDSKGPLSRTCSLPSQAMIAMANREVEKLRGEDEQETWTLSCVNALTAPSHVFINMVTSYSNSFLSPPSDASYSGPRDQVALLHV